MKTMFCYNKHKGISSIFILTITFSIWLLGVLAIYTGIPYIETPQACTGPFGISNSIFTYGKFSSAQMTVNSGVLGTNSMIYATGYDFSDMSGSVLAMPLSSSGVPGQPVWDAGCVLTGGACVTTGASTTSPVQPGTRTILTSGEPNGGGIVFEWANISTTQQTWLDTDPVSADADGYGPLRLAYIRGDRTQEVSGSSPLFRARASLLGPVVNSSATYHARPSSGYQDTFPAGSLEATAAASGHTDDTGSYEQFVYNHRNDPATLYVGANDGMLHAFDATNGVERWAYIPYAVTQNLNKLTAPGGAYQPFVDNSPEIMDVFTNGQWRTLLVGTLRMGGRGVYAVDITNTASISEEKIPAIWEFSGYIGSQANDLGYTFGQPNIVRLPGVNGKWVILVPAGYFDSNTGMADLPTPAPPSTPFTSLFVLDAVDGHVIAEMKTPGTYKSNSITSYGLATAVAGSYGGQVADFAIAGDLVGNLWRFDLTDPTANSVDLMYDPAGSGGPGAGAQPITSMPQLLPDTVTQGVIAVFGTGKYLGTSDTNVVATPTQAYYGIREYGKNSLLYPANINDLVQQTLTIDSAGNRFVTTNSVPISKKGWYFNLTAPGERNVLTPGVLFNDNEVVLETLIPTHGDPCNPSSSGAVMIVDASTGAGALGLPGSGAPASSSGVPTGSQAAGQALRNPPTAGEVPLVTTLGGGQIMVPGASGSTGATLTTRSAYWHRREWRVLSDGL
ncbi:MAG: hypothetical protein LBQ20_02835 [Rhodanobacter sp.]|jgi:type IV pilus assembly protein PilY1|nr:hypothetical protein [Rhodanobacter sp.]